MPRMAVITPSFAPDYELCADLNASLLENSPESVHHHIIVPRSDVAQFRRLANARTHIRNEAEFLPRSFVRPPFGKFTFNLRHLYPPLRGWVLQQIIKLAAAAASTEDVVLLVDSDIEFVRPFSADTFLREGAVRFYRLPGGVDERMPRHVIWHRVARSLLGLPQASPPLNDYISSLLAWDPAVVRRLLEHVSHVTGRPWHTAVGANIHLSEWTLYGVFVDEIAGPPANAFASDDPLCLAYWGTAPLDQAGAAEFLQRMRPTDIAAMISAKSRTPLAAKRAAFADLRAKKRVGSS